MFSRISPRPVAFTGAIHNFGDQSSPQNLIGAPTQPSKDEFRHYINKAVQNSTQPPNIEQVPSLVHRREKAPVNGAPMSYTGGWANPMNPAMGGAPIPHSDQGLESPSFQNRTLSAHQFSVPPNQAHQPYFRGIDQRQSKPPFMATIADYPSIKRPERIEHTANLHPSKTAEKGKLQAVRTHHTSKWPFAMNLPYGNL